MSAFSCPLCGDASPSAASSAAGYEAIVEGAGVCGQCADRVANAYNKKHGGRWLTWPNDRPAPRYKKAKIGAALQRQVHERYKYRCVTCGSHLDLTCDHITPEVLGGETTLENLQSMCRPCNSSKGSR